MRNVFIALLLAVVYTVSAASISAQSLKPDLPTWWAKYQTLLKSGPGSGNNSSASVTVGANVDVSNECGPQSETYVTLDQKNPNTLTAGSNEIFRLPMRGYFSTDGGGSWGGVDLPLPPPLSGTNDTRFGSDPTLAYDSTGNVFYGYIVVFFGHGTGINGTELAVARSGDGGKTYPQVNFFSFSSGKDHFNDKPMITADKNPNSLFRDNVYIAWDAASGGSTGGGIRLAHSSDHGATFAVTRVDSAKGPGRGIGAVPFVGTKGEVYVAWNDFEENIIAFNRSFDGGVTWDQQRTIAPKVLSFQALVPAESFRGALVYPACDVDSSNSPHRGRLYCAWMDQNGASNTDIFLSFSDDRGTSWSSPQTVADRLLGVDRFNHWLSVDPVTGNVTLSFYDTRNDTTGARFMTDVFLTESADGGVTFLSPNVRVTNASSNEHDCNGLFPCPAIDYGNQYGDYEGLVSFGGVSHPIWTDSRANQQTSSGCTAGLMEEVFTATAVAIR
jgi:hypothetical protein